jgi:hypothetical protein
MQSVFLAQSGPSPFWSLLSYWVNIIGSNYVVIAVTDRAVVVLRAGRLMPAKPKAMKVRGPRQQFPPQSGLWGQIQLDVRYFVNRRFFSDLEAANAAQQSQLEYGWQSGYPQQQPPPG